jgi:hypothetical protein
MIRYFYAWILIMTILMSIACSTGKGGRIILLPKDYEGIAIIIYDVTTGAKKEFENGKQLFRIPETGVLKTQFALDMAWVESDEINYFYELEDNKRGKIARVDFPSELPIDSVQIIGEQVGVTSEIPNKYFSFLVCPNSKSDSLSRLRDKLDFKEILNK